MQYCCLLAILLPFRFALAAVPLVANNQAILSLPLPAKTTISSGFGMRIDPISGHWQAHHGIDLSAQFGSPILAANTGKVIFAGYLPNYGNMVEIEHASGIVTRYGHAERILVNLGDMVQRAQTIALVGNSGRSTGPHLHFEVMHDHTPMDPSSYLSSIPPGLNLIPSGAPLQGKFSRVHFTLPPPVYQSLTTKKIQTSGDEIRPRIIYLSNKK